MTNIKDIAKLAGVSITTVSRVLNNHPYVSEDKRKKVQQIIEELEYHQNLNAVNLVKGKTFTVGVILPYIDHPYFQLIVAGIMDSAISKNYSVLICPTKYSRSEEIKYLNMLKGKQIDGFIICSRANHWDSITPFKEYGPIVACEQTDYIPCVFTDHYHAFRAGLEYLMKKGHTSIGYSTGRKKSFSSQMRSVAYTDVLKKAGYPIEKSWIFTDCLNMENGKQLVKKLIHIDNRPTALLVNGDEVAAGIMIQAKQEGMRIPEDLSIVGFDNYPFSEALDLTTIDQNLKEIGKHAFDLFFDGEDKKISIPFHLIERNTVKTHLS
jgi:DNA-binding LacI/PurR family transcriptional regulator